MCDCMQFPETVEEFMEQYKIVDTEQVYTNGTELVPIFRMQQWFEHLPAADVRPAKKAMCEVEGNGWTEHVMEYTDWRCHACGGFWTVCAGIGEAFDKYSFCPRCGAELT